MTFERPSASGQPGNLASPAAPQAGRGLRGKLVLIVFAILFASAIGWAIFRPQATTEQPAGGGRGRAARGAGTVPVGVATVKSADIDVTLDALGTVTPLATVTVKTQIAGQLQKIGFVEGQKVKAGDFLAQIDPRPYEAQLAQYEGQLHRDQALLQGALVDLQRYKTLVAEDSIASQTYDTQVALVEQYRGTVRADQAQVDLIKVDLAYCHIISPVTGRVGLRQVDQGNYVQTSDANGIVVVTQLQPISVVFTLAEDNLPAVLKRMHGDEGLTVAAYDRGGLTKLGSGLMKTIDNQIDTSTGTVKLRALFDNADELLFPNQFVNIHLLVDTHHNVPLVPASAIQTGQPGTFVYVVKDDNTVTVRPVKLGATNPDTVEITGGVRPGERVVIDGADKLREGATVTVAEAPDPNQAAAPKGERRRRGDGAAGGAKGDAAAKGDGAAKGEGGGKADAAAAKSDPAAAKTDTPAADGAPKADDARPKGDGQRRPRQDQ